MIGPDDVRLDGRIAVVTGAAKGIGAAVAGALARFGADVAACDRDEDQLASVLGAVRTAGRNAHRGVLDVREGDAVREWVGEVFDRFGRIDILVNNAGGGFGSLFLDLSDKGQDVLVRENFSSVTHFVRACVPHMPYGSSIVNITSIEAHRAGPGFAIYSAMKAAVANLTKSLALELGVRGIRVNCVAPDVVPTPGIGNLPGEPSTPLGRWGHVDDVAGAVAWLAGPTASFVTGTTVHIDGGNWAAGGWHRNGEGAFST
jgi:3-oxoacyl-[acyl-carrier protein] reductase